MKSFRDALSEVRSLETHPLVKKARKAHKDGVWDGNVDKEGNPIVHINGRPHTVKEAEELDEAKYTPKQYKMAFGVLNDPRWKGGNMTQIVSTIEKIAKGLSKDKAVAHAIQVTNEELDEASFSRPGKGERIIGDSKFEILKYPSGLYSINFVNVRDGDIFIGKEDLLRFQKFMTKVKV